MSKKPLVYAYSMSYESSLDMVEKLLEIHDLLNTESGGKITAKQKAVMSYYIHLGYSKETKEEILKNLDITPQNLNQINSVLRKKGYLKKDKYNIRVNHISDKMTSWINYFMGEEGRKLIVVELKEK